MQGDVSKSGRFWFVTGSLSHSVPLSSTLRGTDFFPATPLPVEAVYDLLRIVAMSANLSDQGNSAHLSIVNFDFGIAFLNPQNAVILTMALGSYAGPSIVLDSTGVTAVQPTEIVDLHLDALVNKPGIITGVQALVDFSVLNNDGAAAHTFFDSVGGIIEMFRLKS